MMEVTIFINLKSSISVREHNFLPTRKWVLRLMGSKGLILYHLKSHLQVIPMNTAIFIKLMDHQRPIMLSVGLASGQTPGKKKRSVSIAGLAISTSRCDEGPNAAHLFASVRTISVFNIPSLKQT